MAAKQLTAILAILAFLGCAGVMIACIAAFAGVKVMGETRLRKWSAAISSWIFGGRGLSQKVLFAALLITFIYSTALVGASFGSREWNLPVGSEKYFCEVDCHLAYAVTDAQLVRAPGTHPNDEPVAGALLYVVEVRTRFDEKTVSPRRTDAPLKPAPRVVSLIDADGVSYPLSESGMRMLEKSGQAGAPITQALRPGESYVTRFAFDVPYNFKNVRLLIESPTQPPWLGKILIGDEDSILHKKIYLALPPHSTL
jgi:hypothetical protein